MRTPGVCGNLSRRKSTKRRRQPTISNGCRLGADTGAGAAAWEHGGHGCETQVCRARHAPLAQVKLSVRLLVDALNLDE